MDPVAIVADVTTMETRPPARPEHVAALEARGFRILGRFATLSGPGRYERLYSRPERARLADWRQRPAATVLAAPDGSAFAGVDTFGDARLLRLRTELDDGSLVETIGVEREGAILPRRRVDPYAGFTSHSTDDHPIRLVDDPSPDIVVGAHRDHVEAVVSARSAHPVRHHDRDHAMRLATRAADHQARFTARGQAILRATIVTLAVSVGGLLLWFELSSDMAVISALLLDLLLFPVVVLLASLVLVVVSRSQRWKPPYLVRR